MGTDLRLCLISTIARKLEIATQLENNVVVYESVAFLNDFSGESRLVKL